jgi:hypothetical protein
MVDTADVQDSFAELAQEISRERGDTHVTAAWEEIEPVSLSASAPLRNEALARPLRIFLDEAGLNAASVEALKPVSRLQAHAILSSALCRDLREERKVMPETTARSLAGRFITLFKNDALFLTNGTHDADGVLREWVALGSSGLDTGIVACDGSQLGLLWFEDETPDEHEGEPEI